MRRTLAAALTAVVVLGTGMVAEAKDAVRREGSCTAGGDWRLEVRHEDANTLRVRFRIEHTPPGDVWEVFLSDNGNRFFAGTRTADASGEVRVSRLTRDLSGTDRIKGYAYSRATGETCSGSLRYDR
jgi:hypothetical protein